MKRTIVAMLFCCLLQQLNGQEQVYPGADEQSPSRAQYFSWINNTNEGATEEHTMINLDFFEWLHEEYGMILDIYAFDAGAIDGKRFYGSIASERFKKQFPNGFDPMYEKAKAMGTRLGVWGGPDGFGDREEEKLARIDQMVNLCKDYEFALFKFDAVCGPLRPEKEDAFIEMMKECRRYSPDLILLNHRLGLNKGKAYATTFLWGGQETYIDVFTSNSTTAPHHRAGALERGLVPGLKRLTEDHGVCISSCLDYWDDDLILQAFNRSMILAPEIYGNPWLLRDDEFPKLARIYNLHRKFGKILVNGMVLPGNKYGPSAVSRGDEQTRLITLRNLSWEPVRYKVKLDHEIGLKDGNEIEVRQFHPTEKVLGKFLKGDEIEVEVAPFRSCLILASSKSIDEPAVQGTDFEVVRNVPGKAILMKLLGKAGSRKKIELIDPAQYKTAKLNGKNIPSLLKGKSVKLNFEGEKLQDDAHRKLADLSVTKIPEEAQALYEASCFAADNNALEVRSLQRSGDTKIPQVQKARDAFFNQDVFVDRGVWDKNLFDGDLETGFWPSRKYNIDQKVDGGCFRLDLGEITDVDQLIIRVPDDYSLQPLLRDEGNYAEVSTDLKKWKTITYFASEEMRINSKEPIRYVRLHAQPGRMVEIEAWRDGKMLDRSKWKASNLFAHSKKKKAEKAWHAKFILNEIPEGGYLSIAINGKHGIEGAYAAAKIGDRLLGCPDRSVSYPSNTWEFVNSKRDSNYTYYLPLNQDMIGQEIEVFVMGYDKENLDFEPEVWISAYPEPYKEQILELTK
ncbi:hypothetical protein [Marinifilum caeruleilacunae]|uniref:F5/8 type C domain-containing protein n=1 Tax=Marinifilum caeruleilacunae TaxID=2499076 RepID=A0ABX1WUT5_9BACT|nr:hypothetical protein [Marinifilum caeruleilacunae]NOU59678.1 hypothetical protein [Marinifilum caeruleilacunae]